MKKFRMNVEKVNTQCGLFTKKQDRSFTKMTSYADPKHPEHKEWLVARRERFYWILGSAKRDCKLLDVEKEMINELRKVLKRNTDKLKEQEPK